MSAKTFEQFVSARRSRLNLQRFSVLFDFPHSLSRLRIEAGRERERGNGTISIPVRRNNSRNRPQPQKKKTGSRFYLPRDPICMQIWLNPDPCPLHARLYCRAFALSLSRFRRVKSCHFRERIGLRYRKTSIYFACAISEDNTIIENEQSFYARFHRKTSDTFLFLIECNFRFYFFIDFPSQTPNCSPQYYFVTAIKRLVIDNSLFICRIYHDRSCYRTARSHGSLSCIFSRTTHIMVIRAISYNRDTTARVRLTVNNRSSSVI